MGFQYDIAVVLGGIKNVYGKNWETLNTDEKGLILNTAMKLLGLI